MHCYRGRHTSRGDERSSTCSLPVKQYVCVIYSYGGMIHVRVLQESFILRNGSILFDEYLYVKVVCCQDIISHSGGNMPATVAFVFGLIPMGYARNNITLLDLYLGPLVYSPR